MLPIPYGRQEVTPADIQAVSEVLQSDYLTQGPRIAAFEAAFAAYIGVPYAVAVANGTAALHLCTLSLGVKPGTRVLCSPLTFAASSNCVLYAGGTVDFVDIDPKTGLLDLDQVADKLKRGSYHGIIPVDYTGFPVDLEALRALADQHGCWIIEDACHAPGGYFTDSQGTQQRCGNGQFADLAIFSFHPVKHIACGEGGMITTRDPNLYEQLKLLRTHGITKSPEHLSQHPGGWYYEMQALGFNYRLSDLHAALGLSQLQRADIGLARRRALAATYDEAFEGTEVKRPVAPRDGGHAYHLYIILVDDRKGLYDYLRSHQIYVQVHYIPVHYLPHYQSLGGWKKGDFPYTEHFYDQCLSLPMYPSMTDEQQAFVIEKVQAFLAHKKATPKLG